MFKLTHGIVIQTSYRTVSSIELSQNYTFKISMGFIVKKFYELLVYESVDDNNNNNNNNVYLANLFQVIYLK